MPEPILVPSARGGLYVTIRPDDAEQKVGLSEDGWATGLQFRDARTLHGWLTDYLNYMEGGE